MGAAAPVQCLTEAEYLALERAGELKNEFFGGEVFAMAGGTRWHSIIEGNLYSEFRGKLRGRSCIPYNANLRVKVEATGLLTYPDLSIARGEPRFLDGEVDTLLNPTLIAEVLSDSTEAYDRGKKFEHYQKIASVNEYLLVRQKEPLVEQFIRQAGGDWLLRQAVGLDATLAIPSLDITISLSEVYANVTFVPGPIRPRTPPRA
jgi:Uma2 family endonuclease